MTLWRVIMCGVLAAVLGGLPAVAKKGEFPGNTVYTDYSLTYIKLDDISSKALRDVQLSHPATITVEKMRQMLSSVAINRRSMFKKDKIVEDGAVFGDRDVDNFAAYLVDALQRATARQIVVFSYLVRNPRMVGGLDRLNTGKIWMAGNQLHIAFDKLYALVTEDTSKRGYDTKTLRQAKGLRVTLEAGAGQSLGNNGQEIVLDTGATFVAKTNSKNVRLPATLTERLEELKKLRDKKLITDDEYNAKRDAIMKNL